MANFSVVQTAKGSETTGTGSYTTTAFGSSVTVGNTLIAVVTSDGSQAGEITGITDNKGNTWVKDGESLNTGQPTWRYVSIWRAPVTAGGSGLILTISYRAADSNNSAAIVQEINSVNGAISVDKTKGNAAAATTSPTTGASSATTAANEFVVAGFASDSTQASFTAGAGYSNGQFQSVASASAGMESKEITSTGAQTATGTWGTSRAYSALLVTYMAAGTITTKTQLGKATIIGTTKQTILGKSRIINTTLRTQLGKASILAAGLVYSYASLATLPTDDTNLANLFIAIDYANVAVDDSVYFQLTGTNTYDVVLFKYKNTNSTSPITVSWNGKSDEATSTSPAFLQIYNYNSATWETLATDTTTSAGTEFTLSATQTSNIANYYTTGNWIAVRVYQ